MGWVKPSDDIADLFEGIYPNYNLAGDITQNNSTAAKIYLPSIFGNKTMFLSGIQLQLREDVLAMYRLAWRVKEDTITFR